MLVLVLGEDEYDDGCCEGLLKSTGVSEGESEGELVERVG